MPNTTQKTTAQISATATPTKSDRSTLLSPLVIALGAILLAQILAALALGFGGKDMSPTGTLGPLLVFDPDQVTAIRIQAPETDQVLIAKNESGWILPTLGDLPAAAHKVTGLLSKLKGLQKGLPVATSDEALKRFKVADQAFERKITLESSNAAPAILYLGDSPGFRRLFVRTGADDTVYEAELGLFDAPAAAGDWSDRTLLHLDAEDIERLTIADVTLKRDADHWTLADLAEGEEQDEQAIEDSVRTLTTIDFLGVLGKEEEPEVSKDASTVEIEATLTTGETIRYSIAKLAEGDDYLLTASNRPQRFTSASYAAEDLTGIGRSDLLKEAEETAASATAEPPAPERAERDNAEDATAQAATTPPTPAESAGETSSADPTATDSSAVVPPASEQSATEQKP